MSSAGRAWARGSHTAAAGMHATASMTRSRAMPATLKRYTVNDEYFLPTTLVPVQRSRAALARYLHYYNRYMNHERSARLEHKLYAKAKSKMEAMQALNMSWIEVQFIKRAVDTLAQCRRTLMYTYAFAFYLRKNNQVVMFEVRSQRPFALHVLGTEVNITAGEPARSGDRCGAVERVS